MVIRLFLLTTELLLNYNYITTVFPLFNHVSQLYRYCMTIAPPKQAYQSYQSGIGGETFRVSGPVRHSPEGSGRRWMESLKVSVMASLPKPLGIAPQTLRVSQREFPSETACLFWDSDTFLQQQVVISYS